jgi:hypothetical protein
LQDGVAEIAARGGFRVQHDRYIFDNPEAESVAMDEKHIEQIRNTRALARYTTRVAKEIDSATSDMHGDHGMESVRTAEHNGHSILVRTHYEFEVDGNPLVSPVMVDNFGRVACHALPNYSFLSAIDLVKQLIETFPEDFSAEHRAPAHKRRAVKARGSPPRKSTVGKQRRAATRRTKVQSKRESKTVKR